MQSVILAIETSTTSGSVALWKDGEIVFEESFRSERNHNSHLFKPLREALNLLGDKRLDLILVGTGPGSYNGSRVAIATAQGIAVVHSCPTVGLCSFHGLMSVRDGESVLVCGDARRETWYVQEAQGGALLGEPRLLDAAEYEAVVKSALEDGYLLTTTDDPTRLALGEVTVEAFQEERPLAEELIIAWAEMEQEEQNVYLGKMAEPMYLRPPLIGQPKPREKP